MTDFYKDCDISSGAVSQWRTGATKPSWDALYRIANYFQVKVGYLLGEEELDPHQKGNITEIVAIKDSESAEMIKRLNERPMLKSCST